MAQSCKPELISAPPPYGTTKVSLLGTQGATWRLAPTHPWKRAQEGPEPRDVHPRHDVEGFQCPEARRRRCKSEGHCLLPPPPLSWEDAGAAVAQALLRT